MAYFADAMMRRPKATMTDPPSNLTVFTASSEDFDKTVCSRTPTIENTNVNPRTKNAEFRNTTSLAFSLSTVKLLVTRLLLRDCGSYNGRVTHLHAAQENDQHALERRSGILIKGCEVLPDSIPTHTEQIGRASCRERVYSYEEADELDETELM